jgi:hypothetical protein
MGGVARSWEPSVPVIPGHEPSKANDGSFRNYWRVPPEDLPPDLGVEWAKPQALSCVIVLYFDARSVLGPAVARTQQWALLQYWDGLRWKDIRARSFGEETNTVRYVFPPITTTRVRLLFTEPPDPEFRNLPGRSSINVCEFEAYRKPPFQWVIPPDRVVRRKDEVRSNYNAAVHGDSSFDTEQPLIIAPMQTRAFADTLTPTLIVGETRWARDACVIRRLEPHLIRLENGFLSLDISTTDKLEEVRLANRVTDESLATPQSQAFLIHTSEGNFAPRDFKVSKVDSTGSSSQVCRITVALDGEKMAVIVHYELRQHDHFYHKWITLKNITKEPIVVRDITLSDLGLPRPLDLWAGPELTYPIIRLKRGGLFECLETVYWDHEQDAMTYYPGKTLASDAEFDTKKAVVGIYEKSDETVAGWDRGVREGVTEYQDHVSPVPKQWPDVYCEGWSADIRVRQLIEHPQWTEHEFAIAEKLGIQYMDAYEPIHQAMAMPAKWVKRWMNMANRYHINTGWWPDFGSGIDWGTGKPFMPFSSLASTAGKTYIHRMGDFTNEYQLKGMHWGDFLQIWLVRNPGTGVLPGKYAIYAQGQEIINFNLAAHRLSPGIMLGGDCSLTNPQFVRFDDDRANCFFMGYYGDFLPAIEPDIHIDRLTADMIRQYVYGAHTIYLLPWYRILNPVNHMGLVSQLHDRAGFRYSLLSALAMAGQAVFNDIPQNIPASEIAFTRHWLNWAKANKEYLQEGDKLFDRSIHAEDMLEGDASSLQGFAHIRKDRGYIFLINPSPVPQIADLTLALNAPATEHFTVQEIYPGGMTLRGPVDGDYIRGGKLWVTVPGKQVRILWIAPGSNSAPQNERPEDARIAATERYVGHWKIVKHTAGAVSLRAQFNFPVDDARFPKSRTPQSKWSARPWAYAKAYLVFVFKNEKQPQNDNYVPDKLQVISGAAGNTLTGVPAVNVNGVSKTLHPFSITTGWASERNQAKDLARCFFVDLAGETKPGGENTVEITAPFRNGMVFRGAYVDLPDQMPFGSWEQKTR